MTARINGRTLDGWRTRRRELERLIRKHKIALDTCLAERDIVDARIIELSANPPGEAS